MLLKKPSPQEQERPDVQAQREAWKEQQPKLDVSSLVFLDETGTNTQMTRLRGRSPIGKRCVASIPQGHWKTETFIASLRVDGLTAPMVLGGPMDGEAFLVYVKDFLCPSLQTGNIVIADNLSSHKAKGVKKAIEAVGASLLYLPSYSPDFNSIEILFSQAKGSPWKGSLP